MQLYLDRLSIEADVSRRLMRLPQLFGDAAVLDEAEQLTQSPKMPCARLRIFGRCCPSCKTMAVRTA